jgi:hypothetical protein
MTDAVENQRRVPLATVIFGLLPVSVVERRELKP